jgi:hypothetical protein
MELSPMLLWQNKTSLIHSLALGFRQVTTHHGGVHLLGGTPLRKNYAGIGYVYDAERDAFYAPQPYPSWSLNEDTCLWDCPVAHPNDGLDYTWDEETLSWVEMPDDIE